MRSTPGGDLRLVEPAHTILRYANKLTYIRASVNNSPLLRFSPRCLQCATKIVVGVPMFGLPSGPESPEHLNLEVCYVPYNILYPRDILGISYNILSPRDILRTFKEYIDVFRTFLRGLFCVGSYYI